MSFVAGGSSGPVGPPDFNRITVSFLRDQEYPTRLHIPDEVADNLRYPAVYPSVSRRFGEVWVEGIVKWHHLLASGQMASQGRLEDYAQIDFVFYYPEMDIGLSSMRLLYPEFVLRQTTHPRIHLHRTHGRIMMPGGD